VQRGIALVLLAAVALGCGSGDDDTSGGDTGSGEEGDGGTLRIGAIPDQDPEVLARNFGAVADHLRAPSWASPQASPSSPP
jgi:phosphonate transport system substrate-binding protein